MKIYFKPSVWLTNFAFPSLLILIMLGSRQVQRLSWNTDIISNYNNNFQQAPITVKELFKDRKNNKYRRTVIYGEYDHANEIQIIGKTYEGNAGFHIITPFILENNEIIYINRGWVPKKYADKKTRKFSLLEDKVRVVGLVRLPQKKGYFVPENEPENGFWFTIIPEELNGHLNIIGEKEFYIDELNVDEKLKLPMPANGKVQVPNNHLQYAITWYSLALGLLIVYFAWHRQNGFLKIN